MSIRIDITPLLANVGAKLKVDEEEKVSYQDDNLVLSSPVKITGEFVNAGEEIVFSGHIKTIVRLNCSHCLKEFDQPLEFDFEEEYRKKPYNNAIKSGEVKLKDSDFVFAVEPDNTIDLSEVVRQNIITELPIQPLCDKLCPIPDEKNKEAH